MLIKASVRVVTSGAFNSFLHCHSEFQGSLALAEVTHAGLFYLQLMFHSCQYCSQSSGAAGWLCKRPPLLTIHRDCNYYNLPYSRNPKTTREVTHISTISLHAIVNTLGSSIMVSRWIFGRVVLGLRQGHTFNEKFLNCRGARNIDTVV